MSKYNFEMVFIRFQKDSCILGNENFNFGLIMNHLIKNYDDLIEREIKRIIKPS